MTRRILNVFVGLSLLIPAMFVAGALGARVPESLVTLFVLVAAVSALAIGALSLGALRVISRDPRLSLAEKMRWRRLIFFTGAVAAAFYFRGALGAQIQSRE